MDLPEGSAELAIVGGGVIGCALAYDLAQRGVKATIFDRRRLAREASWASAGIISAPTHRFGTKSELALLAYKRYPKLVDEIEAATGITVGAFRTGKIDLASTTDAVPMRDTVEWRVENGIRSKWLPANRLYELEPAVGDGFAGGILSPDTFSLPLGQFSRALATAATQNGAVVHENTLVSGIAIQRGKAVSIATDQGLVPVGAVVIAAGAWSRMFGADLGVKIGTIPVRGQMIAVAAPPRPINHVIGGEGGYLVPWADGTIAVGATEEPEAGFDNRVTPAGIDWLSRLIDRLAPSLNRGKLASVWSGLRPGSDDGELIIGKAPGIDNVWIATGHFRGGALLAPGTSEILAECIVSDRVDPRLAPFEPGRTLANESS